MPGQLSARASARANDPSSAGIHFSIERPDGGEDILERRAIVLVAQLRADRLALREADVADLRESSP